MRSRPIALALLVVAACADPPAPAAPAAAPVTVPRPSPPAGPADAIVATVDGAPVWASCVAEAGARLGGARAGLDECVGFELLAQAAASRGADEAPEVQAELRRLLADALIARGFEQAAARPEALPAELLERAIADAGPLVVPEQRESHYVRAVVAGPGQPGLPDDEARALAQAVYDRLPAHRGLTMLEVLNEAQLLGRERFEPSQVGPGTGRVLELAWDPIRAERADLDPTYGDALFALADLGDVSPPVRTPWGWDLILYTDRQAPRTRSREDVVAEVLPDVQHAYFSSWVAQTVGGRHDVRVDVSALEAYEARRAAGGAPP